MKHSMGSLPGGIALGVLMTPAAMARDITIDLAGKPSSLDPHLQWSPDIYYVYRNVFDNLVTRDNAGRIVPRIATERERTKDTELTPTIREGVTFHDGSPLTPDTDVRQAAYDEVHRIVRDDSYLLPMYRAAARAARDA